MAKNKADNTDNNTNKKPRAKATLSRRDERKKELQTQLNSKQLTFCHNYILDSSSAVEAYMTAYPSSSYDAARSNSTRLLKNQKVRDYINILLDEQQDLIEISEKEIYRELKRIALTSPNENTRLKAIDQLVKLKGMIQTGDTTTNNTLIQIGIVDTNSGKTDDINDIINSNMQNNMQQSSLQEPPVIMPVKIIEDDNDNTDNYAYDTLTDTDDIDDL